MADVYCPRQIIFEIPGKSGVQVSATENGAGGIDFVVTSTDGRKPAADLRGLFFEMTESKLGGLAFTNTSAAIVQTQVKANSVLDMGNGANLLGATKAGFDVGIEFGTPGRGRDMIDGPVSFTLVNSAGNLTLDDIAHQRFGARTTSSGQKLIITAPAAPDANDDTYTIFEDNSNGLDDPSKTPVPYKMFVLANDTDADGDLLTITSIHEQPDHGTISIVDGGTALLYTPQTDYAGQVSFEYCISDGDGGQDSATVVINLTPVADIPLFDVVVEATDAVNEVLITVTVNQNDADSSEFIDSIGTSALPAGVTITPVTVDPADTPDQIVQEYLLTLPLNQDTLFDLTFTATAKESVNGDTQTASVTVPINLEYNHTDVSATFEAEGQSIWGSGDAFEFVDDRFFGVDTGDFNYTFGSGLYAGISGHVKLGFQSTLEFNGGTIDATADYEIDLDTNYNKTVDLLRIDIGTAFVNAAFATVGPTGSYVLDFLYDILLDPKAGINIDFGSIDFDPLGVIPGDQTVEIGRITEETHFGGPFSFGPGSFNLIDLNSDDLGGSIELPAPLNSISLNFAWPNIETTGSTPPSPATGSGSSNNFFEVVLDVDTLLTQLLGVPNVFDPPAVAIGPFFADPDLLDVDVIGGLNFLQTFTMAMDSLVGMIEFEDGSSQLFDFGITNLLLENASQIDLAGDADGIVEFTLTVGPEAMLTNDTDLGFNIGASISLFSIELGYDLGGGVSDSVTFGPVVNVGATAPIGDIGVYDSTFALNFNTNVYSFGA